MRAKAISESLKCDFALIDKRRVGPGEYIMNKLEGNIENRHCVLIDDIIDTGGTICKAANLLKERGPYLL